MCICHLCIKELLTYLLTYWYFISDLSNSFSLASRTRILDGTRRLLLTVMPTTANWFSPLTPKSEQHVYEPKYICDQTWVKFPSLVFKYGVHKVFETHRLTHGRTNPNTECLWHRSYGGGCMKCRNTDRQARSEMVIICCKPIYRTPGRPKTTWLYNITSRTWLSLTELR